MKQHQRGHESRPLGVPKPSKRAQPQDKKCDWCLIKRSVCNEEDSCSACKKDGFKYRPQRTPKLQKKGQSLKEKCHQCFINECYCDKKDGKNPCGAYEKYHHFCRSQDKEASERGQPSTEKCNRCYYLKRHCNKQLCSICRDQGLLCIHDHIVDSHN